MSDFGGTGGRTPPPQFPTEPPLLPPSSPVPPGAVRSTGLWGAPAGPPPTPAPPSRKVPGWVVAVAVVAVLALVAGVVAAVAGRDDGDGRATAPFEREDRPDTTLPAGEDDPPATVPEDELPPVPDLATAIEDIKAFVAEARGLPWQHDVTVELLDDEAFQDRLLALFDDEARADLEVAGLTLRALGLLPPGTDIVAAYRQLLGAGVLGFYDIETEALVVKGTEATPYVRTVIAHELTHALDDQHFELHRPDLEDATDERGFGFDALIEGDADTVERAYRRSLSAVERRQADAEELALGADLDLSGVPPVLIESMAAPYVLGPALVDDIVEAGGRARLDEAFVAPPTTSEQLLDPARFLGGEGAVAVAPPPADGPELDRGTLGALGLAQLLGQSQALLGGAPPSAAVEGWGGDAYVLWTEGDRACVRTTFVGDTAEDTGEIADALGRWAADPRTGVATTLLVSDVVTLTACG